MIALVASPPPLAYLPAMENAPPFMPADLPAAATRQEWLRHACVLLGGQVAVAAMLGVTDRTLRRLVAGESPLHDGFVADVVRLLNEKAAACTAAANACTATAEAAPPA